MANEAIEGNEWATYGALDMYHLDETRDRLPVQAYGDGALIVLVRVTSHQGVWEGHTQGEAAQVVVLLWGRARDVQSLNTRNTCHCARRCSMGLTIRSGKRNMPLDCLQRIHTPNSRGDS
jgi:hypothetical protein